MLFWGQVLQAKLLRRSRLSSTFEDRVLIGDSGLEAQTF